MSQIRSNIRTRSYIRQMQASFIFKSFSVLASFLAVPLMISYLGQEQFGVWSTILSIMSWIVFFDMGIGNGLRNEITKALIKEDGVKVMQVVSSGYSLIGIVSAGFYLSISAAVFFIPWPTVFNTKIVSEEMLMTTVLISAFFIFLNFWLSLINSVLNAFQKTSAVVFGQFVTNTLALVFVYFLKILTENSLLYLVVAYGFSLILSNILLSFLFYRSHRDLLPRFSLSRIHVQPLLASGLQFFVIQIAVLVIFSTDKILITQLFGPQYVTQYDVVYKLFSIFTIIHSLITAPLWTSYSDAYHRRDFLWIKKVLRQQIYIFVGIFAAVIAVVPIAPQLVGLWVGADLKISMPLVVSVGLFSLISIWSNIFSYCVNGIGEIRLQLIVSLVAMLVNIPAAIYLTKYMGFGVEGIVIATCLSLSIFAVLGPFQVFNILNDRTK